MNNDPALQWLAEQMAIHATEDSLWCADENTFSLVAPPPAWTHKPRLISNRCDIADLANEGGINSQFNDFDFSHILDHTLQAVFYRVSKEKPVVHHVINEALRILVNGGQLYLSGHKNEGVKTYIEKAANAFGCDKSSRKNGTAYSAILTKNNGGHPLLDTSDYHQLRPVAKHEALTFYSKPGLFGWNKIDQGSEFLIAQLNDTLLAHPQRRSLLDLGCGYGYLTLMTAHLPIEQRVMTDNNAAAITAARFNMAHNNVNAEVVAANCAAGIDQRFDLIICNPPFHQGFSIDGDLTQRFLAAAKRLLAEQGVSLWVVNQFIPLERKASEYFKHVEKIAENRSFKVIALSHQSPKLTQV